MALSRTELARLVRKLSIREAVAILAHEAQLTAQLWALTVASRPDLQQEVPDDTPSTD